MIRVLIVWFFLSGSALAAPLLNFSDIESGPKTGNSDGVGSGAIVTIWGHNLGSTQGTSKVYVGNVEATAVYYWKDADGTLPGGPADLKTYHKMQEIAFAVPATAVDGANTIKVTVGTDSNTLPFTVRAGNIYFIKSTGNDTTGNGSWSTPWLTLGNVLSGNGKITGGDLVYSVGVGSSSSVNVGSTAAIVGTATTRSALLAYPNSSVAITGTAAGAIRNWGNANYYWTFGKLAVTATTASSQAFYMFGYGRYIGNYITGPTVGTGVAGWIGGNCSSTSVVHCSGHKVLGNEVTNYGNIDAIDNYNHLVYMSNRSGQAAEAFEIGWNNNHDNAIYHGIHVYDQDGAGTTWSGTIKIHDNVVKNNSGNAININPPASNTAPIEIYNNLLITDTTYTPSQTYAPPLSAFRIEPGASTSVKVYNNTVYGYGAQNNFASGILDFRNNIIVDTRNVAYSGSGGVTTNANNLFYSTVNPSLALPTWATGELNINPLFSNPNIYDFSLYTGSPALNAGYNTTTTAPYDFLGALRTSTPDIGAFGVGTGTPPSLQHGACGPVNRLFGPRLTGGVNIR